MRPRKVQISKSRQVRTYAELWHASRVLCDLADVREEGSTWTSLASILLTAFTIEAYLNHIGPKLFTSWSTLESLSPQSKLDLISEKIGLKLAAGRPPLQSVGELVRFRNALAHGKSHTISPEDVLRDADEHVEKFLRERPLADWEKLCTPAHAKRFRRDVEKLVHAIHTTAGIKGEYPFVHGVGISSASLE